METNQKISDVRFFFVIVSLHERLHSKVGIIFVNDHFALLDSCRTEKTDEKLQQRVREAPLLPPPPPLKKSFQSETLERQNCCLGHLKRHARIIFKLRCLLTAFAPGSLGA